MMTTYHRLVQLGKDGVADAVQQARRDLDVYSGPALEQMRAGLAALRRSKGLSQAEVAKRIGVTQATVSRLESGSRVPDPDTIRRYVIAVEGSLACAVCGASGACAEDALGRPLIHAAPRTLGT
jgi:predicted transcriptional regulator